MHILQRERSFLVNLFNNKNNIENTTITISNNTVNNITDKNASGNNSSSSLSNNLYNNILVKNSSSNYAIEVENIAKIFNRLSSHTTLKKAFIDAITFNKNKQVKILKFTALKDVSFNVKKGETFGIIGPNGAGKSTLLKILCKIMKPTAGKIAVNGSLSALLELGTGFHPELTGRENILINGLILGLSKKEILAKYDEIIEFSGIKDFIDEPIKTYSSGMAIRLSFSVAVNVNPDILILDEVLAVGDAEFQAKSKKRIETFINSGRTVLLVSHDKKSILSYCSEAMLLHKGGIIAKGKSEEVVNKYEEIEQAKII
jgi:lipopolysaccharide transport system ATP-binding protein